METIKKVLECVWLVFCFTFGLPFVILALYAHAHHGIKEEKEE